MTYVTINVSKRIALHKTSPRRVQVPGAVVDQADGFIVHQALVAEFAEAVGLFDG